MPPVILIKSAVRLIATIGVAKVLSDVVKTNTVVHTTLDKVLVNVGGFTLGSMIVEQTSSHVERVLKVVQKEYEESKETDDSEVEEQKDQQ
jgi:hypothetical protein